MIKRQYYELIKEYLTIFPCVAILGPRQCGKTTLIRSLPNDSWTHFDLERSSDFDHISQDPDLFLRQYPDGVTIDEAQLLPQLFNALRVAIDASRAHKGRYILSVSSSPQLLSSISESLAGRIGVIEMGPLSFGETVDQKLGLLDIVSQNKFHEELLQLDPKADLNSVYDFVFRGGYPEPWLEKDTRFQKVWMEQYVKTYLERDLARLFPGIDSNRYRIFLQQLASLTGTIINYSDLGRSLAVSQPTARDYLKIADGTFIWRTIPSYEKNSLKRIVKHPKGYLRDSGLAVHQLRIPSLRDLLSHPKFGQIWESVVIEEIIRKLNSLGTSFDFFYYRTAAGAEVDLIIEGDFGLIPIEIKHTSTVTKNHLRSLRDFVKERSCNFGLVIGLDEKVRRLDDKIISLPFTML